MQARRHPTSTRQWLAPALAATLACAWLAAPAAASSPVLDSLSGLPDLAQATERLLDLLRQGLVRHPPLMLAGGVALCLPLVALVAALSRAIRQISPGARRARRLDGDSPVTTGRRRTGKAWIELENRAAPPLPLGELVRIGRGEDCDLFLADSSLAEMHALIQRTPDSEFVIFDVSADEGAGLAVNGRRSRRSRLRDGDCIELGSSRVVFRMSSGGAARAL